MSEQQSLDCSASATASGETIPIDSAITSTTRVADTWARLCGTDDGRLFRVEAETSRATIAQISDSDDDTQRVKTI